MVKLSNFYILFACTALCLFGCGKEERAPEVENEPVQTVEEAEPAPEEAETDLEEEHLEEEQKYHPIKKGAVDYLSVKGITLEPGAEIAMVATDSENIFWDAVKSGAQKAVSDLNAGLGYSGKDKIIVTEPISGCQELGLGCDCKGIVRWHLGE